MQLLRVVVSLSHRVFSGGDTTCFSSVEFQFLAIVCEAALQREVETPPC